MKLKSKRSKKVNLLISGGLLMSSLFSFGYGHAINTIPELNIPSPTMPNPNAFDFFVKAGNAIQAEKAKGSILSDSPDPETKTYSLTEKKKLVTRNGEAIGLLHQGFTYSYLNPPARSLDIPFPYYAQFRKVARLLRIKGQMEALHGDYNAAMQSWLDVIQLGEMMPHGSIMLGMLVGLSCEAMGRQSIWEKGLDHLTVTQAKIAVYRLEDIESLHVSFADTLQEEKWAMLSTLKEIFWNPDWEHKLNVPQEENHCDDGALVGQLVLSFYGKGRILKNIANYLDDMTGRSRKPYALHLPSPLMPPDPYSQILMPVFNRGRIKEVESETQNRLLLLALALHAYHEEKHTYPATLAELAPAYLKQLPNDPFALSGGFQYRRDGTKFLLYSVGPDGKDDGGKPIDNPEKSKSDPNSRARYTIEEDSLGDIVVGVNTH